MNQRNDESQTAISLKNAGPNKIGAFRLGFNFFTFMLGFALVLGGLGYWGLGDRVAHSQVSGEAPVFGPKTYTRTTAKPRPVSDMFTVSSLDSHVRKKS